jgi:anti-sigma factor RsiW
MNHRIYEDWLFDYLDPAGTMLEEQQSADLKRHLQTCPQCQDLSAALRKVEGELRRVPQAQPEPGFTMRWQARLQAEQALRHRRQSMAGLAFGVGIAFLLFGSLVILVLPWLAAPQVLFWTWLYRFFTLASYVDVLRDLLSPLLQAAVGALPVAGWVLAVGLVCELSVLWLVSFRLATNPRKV